MIDSSDDDDNEINFNLKPDSTELKIDHANRPLWISNNGRIILESFSPVAAQAKDLLLAIAEPITRPKHMHEYQISAYSLYAAVSVGIEPSHIIHSLELFSKTILPVGLKELVFNATKSFGKVKLVLRDNKFWIESQEIDILEELLKDKEVMQAKVLNNNKSQFSTVEYTGIVDFKAPIKQHVPDYVDLFEDDELFNDINPDDFLDPNGILEADNLIKHIMIDPTIKEKDTIKLNPKHIMIDPTIKEKDTIKLDTPEEIDTKIHSFEINKSKVELVKKKCSELQYPVLEEYDFRADLSNATLDIDLKPAAKLRPYQEKSLSKLFSNGRARSGYL
jgi:DNA excision repair protein ERCC-3